jgi:ferrous iron transport protein A
MSANPITNTVPHEMQQLASLKKGDCAIVIGLDVTDGGAEQLAMKTRLLELGFAPGEKIRVVAQAFPRRDPIAVRLGNTTFALRRHEAAMIQVVRSERNVA